MRVLIATVVVVMSLISGVAYVLVSASQDATHRQQQVDKAYRNLLHAIATTR